MNTLDFLPLDPTESEFSGFRLLVDGLPISQTPGCVFGELSYWEFGDELCAVDTEANPQDCYRIVGVCDCGHSGCAATWVRVTKRDGKVRLSEFSGLQKDEVGRELTFTEDNYEQVMRRMRALAAQYQARDRSQSE